MMKARPSHSPAHCRAWRVIKEQLSPPCKGGVWGGGQGSSNHFVLERRGGGQGSSNHFVLERRGGGQGSSNDFDDERPGRGTDQATTS
jgi:hypothetical protein